MTILNIKKTCTMITLGKTLQKLLDKILYNTNCEPYLTVKNPIQYEIFYI